MAIAGTGIAILPNFLGMTECQTGELVRILPKWSISKPSALYLLHEGWRLLPAKVNCFRDFMIDRFRQTNAEQLNSNIYSIPPERQMSRTKEL
jgi:DNA-binding transcriptional LysR family regulator